MKASEQRSRNALPKLIGSIGAVLIIATASAVAREQTNSRADVRVVASYTAPSGYKSKPRVRAASFSCPRFRGHVWRDIYECQEWQQSFSPFWAWDVTASLLATAPTSYNWIPFTLEYDHWP
jgi:hypothetical protein